MQECMGETRSLLPSVSKFGGDGFFPAEREGESQANHSGVRKSNIKELSLLYMHPWGGVLMRESPLGQGLALVTCFVALGGFRRVVKFLATPPFHSTVPSASSALPTSSRMTRSISSGSSLRRIPP
jgi:hypothetical protein